MASYVLTRRFGLFRRCAGAVVDVCACRRSGGPRLALRVAVFGRVEASGVGPLAGGVSAQGAVKAALGPWRALCRCGVQARCR